MCNMPSVILCNLAKLYNYGISGAVKVLIWHIKAQRCSVPSALVQPEIFLKCLIYSPINVTLLCNEISPGALFVQSELITVYRVVPALKLWWFSSRRDLRPVWTVSCRTPGWPGQRSQPAGCLQGAGGGRWDRSAGASLGCLQEPDRDNDGLMVTFLLKLQLASYCMQIMLGRNTWALKGQNTCSSYL